MEHTKRAISAAPAQRSRPRLHQNATFTPHARYRCYLLFVSWWLLHLGFLARNLTTILFVRACACIVQSTRSVHVRRECAPPSSRSLALFFPGSQCSPLGPKHWADLCNAPLCGSGRLQSPINLNTRTAIRQGGIEPLIVHYSGVMGHLIYDHRHFEVFFPDSDGYDEHVEGGPMNDSPHKLKELHFHAPSEHQLDGKVYPLEAHFENVDALGDTVVLSVLFLEGDKRSELIDEFLRRIPSATTLPDSGPMEEVDAELLFTSLHGLERKFFFYNGSLTTPPCREGQVHFLIFSQPVPATPDQIEMVASISLERHNARPVQPSYNRTIFYYDEELQTFQGQVIFVPVPDVIVRERHPGFDRAAFGTGIAYLALAAIVALSVSYYFCCR